MGFLSSAIAERKGMTSHDIWLQLYGGRKSSSGKTVNIETATQVSAVFANLRLLGNGMAQVPLKLMQETADGKKRQPAKNHPLYKLMAVKPNRWQTSFQWRQMMSWHVELCGNHYSFQSKLNGKVVELFPFLPNQVEEQDLSRGVYQYKVTLPNAEPVIIPAGDMLHIRGPSWDGHSGLDILKAARDAIGLSIAAEESAGSLHKNGIQPSGVYTVDGKLTSQQHNDLQTWISEHYSGPDNKGLPLILDRAAKWSSMQMTGVDAQALETRNHQIEEVCRFFGTMPIMVGYSDKTATYASAEQMFLAHLVHALAPRWENIEQVLNAQLLTEREQEQGYYFDFIEEGMIRASAEVTQKVLLGYVNGGLMTPNEGRSKLDLNPMDDDDSDKLRIPANITGSVQGVPTDNHPQG